MPGWMHRVVSHRLAWRRAWAEKVTGLFWRYSACCSAVLPTLSEHKVFVLESPRTDRVKLWAAVNLSWTQSSAKHAILAAGWELEHDHTSLVCHTPALFSPTLSVGCGEKTGVRPCVQCHLGARRKESCWREWLATRPWRPRARVAAINPGRDKIRNPSPHDVPSSYARLFMSELYPISNLKEISIHSPDFSAV